tara:strand:+ start:1961 stop:3835 length:1875 start_codon:yes stop_codon:yes gene_type:complete
MQYTFVRDGYNQFAEYPTVKIALAQINPTIGDIHGNVQQIRHAISEAQQYDAELVVLPELAIVGYPPKDLLLKPSVINDCEAAVQYLAGFCGKIAAVIGYPRRSDDPVGRPLLNAAAFCQGGRVVGHRSKSLLPTYDVFDESRYFEPQAGPTGDLPLEFHGVRLGITICEDLWNDQQLLPRKLYRHDPLDALADADAQIMINCSASPFVVGKPAFRLELFAAAAKRWVRPLIYCNQVGGNDELVFDGNSCVVGVDGNLIAAAKSFETDLLVVDVEPSVSGMNGTPSLRVDPSTMVPPLEMAKPQLPEDPERSSRLRSGCAIESVYQALVLGLRDYCHKCGFKSIVVGLSGGIDSAVTAALAVAAMGKSNVIGVAMPSRYSSPGSVTDAEELADVLGLAFHKIPIAGPHHAFEQVLAPHFDGLEPDATEENIQARIRGVILMAFSNKNGALLVTTGNKSELAVGYCTLYGDMCGGMAVLNDVPKTMVWELAQWINNSPLSPLRDEYGCSVIPPNSITKVPSAELRPGQSDQDSLPPYEVLDQIIEYYVEQEQSVQQIIDVLKQTVSQQTITRMVQLIDRNEYKRKQAAPGIKVTGRAFGFGRRMPIAQRYKNGALNGIRSPLVPR